MLRVDARAQRLAPRLQPGDIAVLDEVDLDGATARALVARGVVAVVNAAPSSSGRYPNLGPGVLVDAGIPLLDDVGPALLSRSRDGAVARLDGDTLWVGEEPVATGMRHDAGSVAEAAQLARAGVPAQLADLTANAAALVVDERALLVEGRGLPTLATRLDGRYVVLVGPGPGAADDLRALRGFRRRHHPLLVGVDGGGDVLLEGGLCPDLLVGEPATMSEAALRRAREVCLREGAEGLDRVADLAVPVVPFSSRCASEDIALLLAHHAGARAVVLAGVPRDLLELLDRGRAAAAASPLTRVVTGVSTLSARSAAALTPGRRWRLPLLCLLLAGGLGGLVALDAEHLRTALDDALDGMLR